MDAATVDDLLAHADDLVAQISGEVERVAGEAQHLGWIDDGLNVLAGIGDELGFEEQADGVSELVDVGRRWVDEDYPAQRDEAEAAQDFAHAQRLVDASQNILTTYTHTSPVDDEEANFSQFVDDVKNSVKKTITLPGFGLFAAAGGIAGVALAATFAGVNPRALLGGAIGGTGLGLLARFGVGKLVKLLPATKTDDSSSQ